MTVMGYAQTRVLEVSDRASPSPAEDVVPAAREGALGLELGPIIQGMRTVGIVLVSLGREA